MPGLVSDSYDPEFSTGENAQDVSNALKKVSDRIGEFIGPELRDILDVVHGKEGRLHAGPLTEREWRIIRFAVNRLIEDI